MSRPVGPFRLYDLAPVDGRNDTRELEGRPGRAEPPEDRRLTLQGADLFARVGDLEHDLLTCRGHLAEVLIAFARERRQGPRQPVAVGEHRRGFGGGESWRRHACIDQEHMSVKSTFRPRRR